MLPCSVEAYVYNFCETDTTFSVNKYIIPTFCLLRGIPVFQIGRHGDVLLDDCLAMYGCDQNRDIMILLLQLLCDSHP